MVELSLWPVAAVTVSWILKQISADVLRAHRERTLALKALEVATAAHAASQAAKQVAAEAQTEVRSIANAVMERRA